MNRLAHDAIDTCQKLLKVEVKDVEQPGGSRRDSVRLYLDNGSVIATRRRNVNRARLEAGVLRALEKHDVPAPRLVAFDSGWLIQEDLGGQRLSQVLAQVDEVEGKSWLGAALESLASVHDAGRAERLETQVAAIGRRTDWLRRLIAMPTRLGDHLGLTAPAVREEELLGLLHIRTPHFIKWDARPGNASAREDRTVAWFDWEHCGARNQLDDVAWLLADEYVPDWAAVEHELLGRYLDRFAGESGIDQAADYLAAFGTFHMCVRLGLIVRHKSDGSWWDREYCLSRDKVGVTLEATRGTCAKAARWAERTPLTEDLVPWFEAVAARLEES